MADALPYSDTDENIVHSYRRVHANGEQTHVAVLSASNDRYAAVAYDLDPAEFTPVAAEAIAYGPTLEGAVERARRWMEQHPKGVAADAVGGGGWGAKINRFFLKVMRRLNEYGNEQREQMMEQQQGGQS